MAHSAEFLPSLCQLSSFGQALHRHDLRIVGRCLRRIDRGDPQARTTGQRRDKHQRQRQKALDLVHHGGHVQPVSHRRLAFARSPGEVGRCGVCRLSELRLLFGQLLVRMELLDQSPVLLGTLDTRYPVLGKASGQENQRMGRATPGPVAAAVFGLAPPPTHVPCVPG